MSMRESNPHYNIEYCVLPLDEWTILPSREQVRDKGRYLCSFSETDQCLRRL